MCAIVLSVEHPGTNAGLHVIFVRDEVPFRLRGYLMDWKVFWCVAIYIKLKSNLERRRLIG